MILLAVAFMFFSEASPAQTKKKTTGTRPKTAEAATATSNSPAAASISYDVKPFDLTAKTLPLGYRGHSFRKMYESAVLVPPKGEFETTAEYQQRAKRTFDGSYAFVLGERAVSATYDADQEVMQVVIRTDGFRPGVGVRDTENGYTVESKKTSEREYIASNAFGASVNVTSTSYDTWGIIPRPGPLSGGATFAIKLARPEAQRTKSNLRAMVVGRIAREQEAPISTNSESNGLWFAEAKIDSPSEIHERQFLLRMELIDLWVFDTTTGAILAKHSEREDHGEMSVSVFESKDHDGYAIVSLAGNRNLTLNRGFSQYGGGCHIVVGGWYEVVGMKSGVWGAGASMVDLRGRKRLVVIDRDGAELLNEGTPMTFGHDSRGEWPHAEAAARLMWQAAPGGFVEVKGDDYSSFPTKASLAGFRELWKWGISNCGFPSLEK